MGRYLDIERGGRSPLMCPLRGEVGGHIERGGRWTHLRGEVGGH